MLRFVMLISPLAAAMAVAACAPAATDKTPARLVHVCDEAMGEATMGDIAAARHFAQRNLQRNLGGSRDYLATLGVKRTLIQKPIVRCAPYALLPGASRCVATARICAR